MTPESARESPFLLTNTAEYSRWRDRKLGSRPRDANDLMVEVANPLALTPEERRALVSRCRQFNMAIYRSPWTEADKRIPRALGAQLGLQRLDANWLADEDGISPISVATPSDGRADFIPYTDRAIKWHTDGYYHPEARCIRGMVLHCVRPAAEGGDTALLDHELAYIAVRDANASWLHALMEPDAMTIPARMGSDGVSRAAQSGPVFSVDPVSGELHMRYTARTRSVNWKDDPATQDAAVFLQSLMAGSENIQRLRLEPGMGLVCNNVLHERTGFVDDPSNPRLLYRARYLDRVCRD